MGGARILVRGKYFLGAGLVGITGTKPPEGGEFSKIFKIFLKQIAKLHYFNIFLKN